MAEEVQRIYVAERARRGRSAGGQDGGEPEGEGPGQGYSTSTRRLKVPEQAPDSNLS